MQEVYYSSRECQRRVKGRRERKDERKRGGGKGAGEMVMSCPVQYLYLWSGEGSDVKIHEGVGGAACGSESAVSLAFVERAYPHTIPHTQNINISCLVSSHA